MNVKTNNDRSTKTIWRIEGAIEADQVAAFVAKEKPKNSFGDIKQAGQQRGKADLAWKWVKDDSIKPKVASSFERKAAGPRKAKKRKIAKVAPGQEQVAGKGKSRYLWKNQKTMIFEKIWKRCNFIEWTACDAKRRKCVFKINTFECTWSNECKNAKCSIMQRTFCK